MRHDWVEERRKEMFVKETDGEKKLAEILDKFGIFYERYRHFDVNGKNYFPDFYLPSVGIIIEIYGMCHIGKEKEDKEREMDLRSIPVIKDFIIVRESVVVNDPCWIENIIVENPDINHWLELFIKLHIVLSFTKEEAGIIENEMKRIKKIYGERLFYLFENDIMENDPDGWINSLKETIYKKSEEKKESKYLESLN